MLDNDTTELDENLEDLTEGDDDTLDGDQGDDSLEGEGGNDTLAADGDTDLVITLEGDDDADEGFDPKAKAALKALRESNKEMRKRMRELEKSQAQPVQEQALRPKPTLADHQFDEEKWEADLLKWADEKGKADQQVAAIQTEFNTKRNDFQAAAKALAVPDYDDAKDAVVSVLDIGQQNAIILNLDKDEAAKVVYALGKSPTRLEALGKIKDPVRFGIELAKISMGVKVTTQPKTKPESALKPGGAASPQTRDLEALRAKAQKSGDYTAYFAAKKARGA